MHMGIPHGNVRTNNQPPRSSPVEASNMNKICIIRIPLTFDKCRPVIMAYGSLHKLATSRARRMTRPQMDVLLDRECGPRRVTAARALVRGMVFLQMRQEDLYQSWP